MSVTRLSPLCLVLIIASSALGNIPYTYPQPQVPLSFGPHLSYGLGIQENSEPSGFPYFQKHFGGGESRVIVLTGPNLDSKFNNEFEAAIRTQLRYWPSIVSEIESNNKDDKDVKPADSGSGNGDATAIAPLIPVESKESSTPATKEESSSATPAPSTTTRTKEEDAKSPDAKLGVQDEQSPNGKEAGFEVPLPILRLGSSASYYPQLPTAFSGFFGYDPISSDYFAAQQYEPSYNYYNSYQSLYNPLYPSPDGDYYNPSFQTAYQPQIFTPPESNVITKKTVEGPNIDKRVGDEDKAGVASEKEKSEKSAQDSSKIPEESKPGKLPELPTSTDREQVTEKEVTVSETTIATSDSKETTTTVASDAVAVP